MTAATTRPPAKPAKPAAPGKPPTHPKRPTRDDLFDLADAVFGPHSPARQDQSSAAVGLNAIARTGGPGPSFTLPPTPGLRSFAGGA